MLTLELFPKYSGGKNNAELHQESTEIHRYTEMLTWGLRYKANNVVSYKQILAYALYRPVQD